MFPKQISIIFEIFATQIQYGKSFANMIFISSDRSSQRYGVLLYYQLLEFSLTPLMHLMSQESFEVLDDP